jgi:hypothetical protein
MRGLDPPPKGNRKRAETVGSRSEPLKVHLDGERRLRSMPARRREPDRQHHEGSRSLETAGSSEDREEP